MQPVYLARQGRQDGRHAWLTAGGETPAPEVEASYVDRRAWLCRACRELRLYTWSFREGFAEARAGRMARRRAVDDLSDWSCP
jgi:hypothetical protein